MSKLSLIQRFSLLCFLSLALFGFVLGWSVTSSMERDMLNKAVEETADVVSQNVIKHFKRSEIVTPKKGKQYDLFKERVDHLSLPPTIFETKFWNEDSVVVWCDNKEIVGKEFKSNQYLAKALNGLIVAEIADSPSVEKKYMLHMDVPISMEIYVPIKYSESPGGYPIVEVYQDLTGLYDTVRSHKTIIWTRIALGFLLLFMVLFGIIFEASRKLQNQSTQLENMFIRLVATMTNALEAKSPWTKGHSKRTEQYAEKIGYEMGLNNIEIKSIVLAGLLHDIGKIGTYDYLLEKVEKITTDEFEIIKKHPIEGVKILQEIKELKNIFPIIKHHHERYDGKGYPDGIKGDEIPLAARIICVADSYDAMTAERPYRKAMSKKNALEELRRNSGTQFDPHVVDSFMKVIEN